MGLNASPDEKCCHSDRLVVGLPWAMKTVNDTIIWAPGRTPRTGSHNSRKVPRFGHHDISQKPEAGK